jgi:regulator of ribonuclease activity A
MSQPFATAELYDIHEARLRSCPVQFRQFGAVTRFSGPIRTVKCYDDNVLMRRTLETAGQGNVLVVDGAGYMGSALIGDQIALIAQQNGWAAVVIHGAVRDVVALAGMNIGIKALGSNPRKSGKAGIGQVDVPVTLGGVTFGPGEWLYSDEDGILVATEALPF